MGAGSVIGGVAGGIGGFFLGGPAGAAAGFSIGAGLGGGIEGMGHHNDPYKAPSFSDIDLQTENPELYAELLKVRGAADEATRLYQARRQGPTYQEQQELNTGLSHSAQAQAENGTLGSSAGNAMQADAEARLRNNIAQRAYQEQMGLYQNMIGADQASATATLNGQMPIFNARNQAGQTNFSNQQAEEQAKNQFFSGLFNAGVGMAGQQMATNQLMKSQLPVNVYTGPTQMPGPFSYSSPYAPTGVSPYSLGVKGNW